MIKFSIGCDPEFFLTQGGSYKAAVGLIGGSKWHPMPLDQVGHAILEDNVAVEFNIAPATTYEAFRASIHKVLDALREKLPGYDFSHESAVSFPPEELNSPQAQEFGCEPDFNAWTLRRNRKPKAQDECLRSAGGHIHVGHELAQKDPNAVIRAMDLYLGAMAVEMDHGELRKQLYGQAGACRYKDYGVEYRTLSNFWIWDDSLIKWAFDGTQRALEFVESGKVITPDDGVIIQRCINNNNKDDLRYLKQAYSL